MPCHHCVTTKYPTPLQHHFSTRPQSTDHALRIGLSLFFSLSLERRLSNPSNLPRARDFGAIMCGRVDFRDRPDLSSLEFSAAKVRICGLARDCGRRAIDVDLGGAEFRQQCRREPILSAFWASAGDLERSNTRTRRRRRRRSAESVRHIERCALPSASDFRLGFLLRLATDRTFPVVGYEGWQEGPVREVDVRRR